MSPRPCATSDFAQRMARAASQAQTAGLDGVLVTPGPDLVYFTGYAPIAITERITVLAISAAGEAAMLVPTLERADAEHARGVGVVTLSGWSDGEDAYAAATRLASITTNPR